jgi:hypothetical protein
VECAVRILKTSVTVAKRVSIRVCGNRCSKCIKYQWIVIGVPDYVTDNPSVIQIPSTGMEMVFVISCIKNLPEAAYVFNENFKKMVT